MSLNKNVEVTPYNPSWPLQFAADEKRIREALGSNCIAIYHVGSTAVPGLMAKPKIDIIAVVKNPANIAQKLATIGYEERGEFNIPFHYGFAKRGPDFSANLHVYEEGNPEIGLNLLFRDYLRSHPEAVKEYSDLKMHLLTHPSAQEKKGPFFRGYTLGKYKFIKKIQQQAGFKAECIRFCAQVEEWETVNALRQRYFFDPLGFADPYTWTFDHKEHLHFLYYLGVEIIGYAHIQLWEDKRAAVRIFVIDEPFRHSGMGTRFLASVERWLQRQLYISLHTEARPESAPFYRQQGYVDMPFPEPSDGNDVPLGKLL